MQGTSFVYASNPEILGYRGSKARERTVNAWSGIQATGSAYKPQASCPLVACVVPYLEAQVVQVELRAAACDRHIAQAFHEVQV